MLNRKLIAVAVLASQAFVMSAQGAEANKNPGQLQPDAKRPTINRIVDNAPTLAELKGAEAATVQPRAAAPVAPKAVSNSAFRADGRDEISRIVDTAGTN